MFPGAHAATDPDKPAVIMGGTGAVMTYAELDEERQPGVAAAPRRRPPARATTSRSAWRTTPASSPSCGARTTPGLYYTAHRARASRTDGAGVHRRRLRRPGLHHVRVQGRAGAPSSSTETPGVELRLMLDGAIDGYEPLRGDASPRSPADAARRTESRATTCSTRSGTTGRPKGVKPPLPGAPLGDDADRRHRPRASCCSASTTTTVYLSPAPLYHAAPLRFCDGVAPPRRHRRRDGALRPRAVPGARRALPRHATQVVPTMFIRLLKLPGRGARRATTCRRCRCVIHAAAPCPVEVKRADHRVVRPDHPRVLRRHRGQRLRLLQLASEWLAHPGTVGTALLGTAPHRRRRRRRAARRASRARSTSRAAPRSSTTTTRRRPPASRDPSGAGRTLGDVGYLDDDGYLYLTDRKAYMIISGGVNIYPQEAENVLVDAPEGASTSRSSACPTRTSARRSRPSCSRSTMADGRRRRSSAS